MIATNTSRTCTGCWNLSVLLRRRLAPRICPIRQLGCNLGRGSPQTSADKESPCHASTRGQTHQHGIRKSRHCGRLSRRGRIAQRIGCENRLRRARDTSAQGAVVAVTALISGRGATRGLIEVKQKHRVGVTRRLARWWGECGTAITGHVGHSEPVYVADKASDRPIAFIFPAAEDRSRIAIGNRSRCGSCGNADAIQVEAQRRPVIDRRNVVPRVRVDCRRH